jgi:hypothetical protein
MFVLDGHIVARLIISSAIRMVQTLTLRQALAFCMKGLLNQIRQFCRSRGLWARSLESALIDVIIEDGGGVMSDCDPTNWERHT